jgi:hypothetical protein
MLREQHHLKKMAQKFAISPMLAIFRHVYTGNMKEKTDLDSACKKLKQAQLVSFPNLQNLHGFKSNTNSFVGRTKSKSMLLQEETFRVTDITRTEPIRINKC